MPGNARTIAPGRRTTTQRDALSAGERHLMLRRCATGLCDGWGRAAVVSLSHRRIDAVVDPTFERRRHGNDGGLDGDGRPAAERQVAVFADLLGQTRISM